MTNQLELLEHHRSWRLDRRTRERGKAGVAAARAAMRQARVATRADVVVESESHTGHRDAA